MYVNEKNQSETSAGAGDCPAGTAGRPTRPTGCRVVARLREQRGGRFGRDSGLNSGRRFWRGAAGLTARAASGQQSATKALQKAGELLGLSVPSGLQFTLTAGSLPPATFVVTDFDLTEGFSQPFSLHVGLASADPAIDFPAVLDRSATLTITQDGIEQRSITGMVARFEQGNTGLHQTTYQMTICPDLWRTTLRQNSRIFQQQDIETEVVN